MWDVAVDKDDDIWIGSGAGLIEYDRKEFTLYNTCNSPLAEDSVSSIAVDHNNILWIASCRFRRGGLMKFDGEHWELYIPENSKLPPNSIRDVIVDSKNNIWVAMSATVDDASIMKISGDEWTIFDKEEIGFVPYYFKHLAVDMEDNIYAAIDYTLSSDQDMTRPNIIKFDGRNWTINNPADEKGQSLGYVRKMNIDLLGNIWASLWGKKGLILAVYNGEKWICNDAGFPANNIFEIAVDKRNRIWLGIENGIYSIEQPQS